MIIGCDIGGVIKSLIDDTVIPNSIESLRKLQHQGHKIIFISKCGPDYAEKTRIWLKSNNLDDVDIIFCENYPEKVTIAKNHNVTVMIDDKLTVLKHFPVLSFKRIWFCTEQKNIAGVKKYDPEFLQTAIHVTSWSEILTIFEHLV